MIEDLNDSAELGFQIPPWVTEKEIQKHSKYFEGVDLSERDLSVDALHFIIELAFQKIADSLPGYQLRSAQVQMAQQMLRSFYTDRSVVIEAATGVGKSFAYIIAALSYSYLTAGRVVLTTETKALQYQLFEKDLPFIRECLDQTLTYELCLGSGNYFCKLRYDGVMNDGGFRDLIEESQFAEIRDWANTVITSAELFGSKFEKIPKMPDAFWSMIARDSDGCPGNRCSSYSNCNYFRARKKWSESRLLVANHHLLLYHLLNEKRTLPAYNAVVIDEAHGLIKTGYSIFTSTFARTDFADLKKQCSKIYMNHPELPVEARTELEELTEISHLRWETFFSRWEVECDLVFKTSGSVIIKKPLMENIDLHSAMESLVEKFSNLATEGLDAGILNQINTVLKLMQKMTRFAVSFSSMNFLKSVYWAEKREERFLLNTCRLNLGDELAELMQENRAYTSATLGYWPYADFPQKKSELVQKGFFSRFMSDALPLAESGSIDCNIFFSPFAYREHAALYAPEHILIPEHGADDSSMEKYFDILTKEIAALVTLSEGGALILFTSNYILKQVAYRLSNEIDLPIFSQLDEGAQESLNLFRQDKNSVLLGSQSFWQGIDVAGDGLRLLIITKLLFTPPDDPIFKARSENMEAKGKKPFFELSLPHASTMLRQAFGRLIRTEKDKGVVAILDGRLWQKSYGKTLIANLPRVQVIKKFSELERSNEKFGFLSYSR